MGDYETLEFSWSLKLGSGLLISNVTQPIVSYCHNSGKCFSSPRAIFGIAVAYSRVSVIQY